MLDFISRHGCFILDNKCLNEDVIMDLMAAESIK